MDPWPHLAPLGRRWLAGLVALAALAASPARGEVGRRFAVVAGNNDGGPGTRPLRYAHEDAQRIHEVLVRLGDVKPEDAILLLEKTADDLRHALDLLEPRMRQAATNGERPLLLFFFSGHTKDGALRFGGSSIPLDEVRARMSSSAAQMRIGLLDSCRSGAITRTKGARKAPAFEVDTGALQSARGLVLLTSSAADEESQESDELHGSFFSHHLASGLMGDADTSGDGRVTLAEAYAYAYAYAYDRTVADTAETAAGPQHPTFSYDLAGNGDVILTDFAARNEGVVFPSEAAAGSYFLVDGKGAVAAEVSKAAGVERRIALAPGSYKVKRRLPDKLRLGDLSISAGNTAILDEGSFKDAPFSDDPVKGAVTRALEPEPRFGVFLGGAYQGFFSGPFPSMPLLQLEVSLRDYLAHGIGATFDLALGGGTTNLALTTDKLAYHFSELGLGVSILKEWRLGSLSPFLGGRVAMIVMSRSFDDPSVPKQGYSVMSPGLTGGARLRLSEGWSVLGRARLHYVYYNVDSRQSLGYLEASVVIGYEM